MKRVYLTAAALLLLGACDSGPSGPGELTGRLQTPGPVLGAAVLEVEGKGITSFAGSGGTGVFFSPTGVEDTYRVVLMAQVPGELQFQVSVQNRGAKKPSVSVVAVASGENLPLPATADYKVRFTK
jgi:hypothetical protein